MEKKEIKRVLERIYRFLKDNKGRFYVDDCETVTLYEGMSEIIDQEPEEKTVEEIAPVYCPPNYKNWARSVNQFMLEIERIESK